MTATVQIQVRDLVWLPTPVRDGAGDRPASLQEQALALEALITAEPGRVVSIDVTGWAMVDRGKWGQFGHRVTDLHLVELCPTCGRPRPRHAAASRHEPGVEAAHVGDGDEPPDDGTVTAPGAPVCGCRPAAGRDVQVRWSTWSEVCELLGPALLEVNPQGAREIGAEEASDTCHEVGPTYIALEVRTSAGETVTVRHGDWLIPDRLPGTFLRCPPALYAAIVAPVLAGGGR